MGVLTGTVIGGKVVVDSIDLPEGSVVTVVTPEQGDEITVTADEEAELLEAIAQVERGESISGVELLERLDRNAKR